MSKVWLLASKVLSALLALAQAVWAGEKGGMVNCAPFISERRKYMLTHRPFEGKQAEGDCHKK